MTHRKLAVLLSAAVMVGSVNLVSTHFAQATQTPNPGFPTVSSSFLTSTEGQSQLQVASADDRLDKIHSRFQLSESMVSAPEVYTIDAKPGALKTLIQVLPHAGNNASLFVNGSEILRFHGTVNNQTAHERVTAVAETLHEKLSNGSLNANQILPHTQTDSHAAMGSVVMGATPLVSVDACTVSATKEAPDKLAFLYANRLRRALGQQALPQQAPDSASASPVVATSQPHYKSTGKRQLGVASWYGGMFHGRRTASGKRFNQYAMTAAHRTLPFGTLVRVVNQRNHKTCVVQITDRGPYAHGRIIDLSRGAARTIGMSGTSRVVLEVIAKN